MLHLRGAVLALDAHGVVVVVARGGFRGRDWIFGGGLCRRRRCGKDRLRLFWFGHESLSPLKGLINFLVALRTQP